MVLARYLSLSGTSESDGLILSNFQAGIQQVVETEWLLGVFFFRYLLEFISDVLQIILGRYQVGSSSVVPVAIPSHY